MKKNRSAFSMIELVFVIVVLGILAGIAIPKFSATRTDAVIVKGRSDIASLQTAISTERQQHLMQGQSAYVTHVDASVANNTEGVTIFDSDGAGNTLLTYGITTKNNDGGWMKIGTDTYTYNVAGSLNSFTYSSADGTFKCTSGNYCSNLTH